MNTVCTKPASIWKGRIPQKWHYKADRMGAYIVDSYYVDNEDDFSLPISAVIYVHKKNCSEGEYKPKFNLL